MTKHYYINRSMGDIIYALPAIKAAGGEVMIHTGLRSFEVLRPLIRTNGVDLCHEEAGIPPGVINLEDFRYHPQVGTRHLCEIFADLLGVKVEYKQGWLVPLRYEAPHQTYSVINVTGRYRDKVFKWWKELEFLRHSSDLLVFMGTQEEHKAFQQLYGKIEYCNTADLFKAAAIIGGAEHFSGTQSACLAIAEGLGRTYRYERSPFLDNVHMDVARETVLNPRTRKMHFFYSRVQEAFRGI